MIWLAFVAGLMTGIAVTILVIGLMIASSMNETHIRPRRFYDEGTDR